MATQEADRLTVICEAQAWDVARVRESCPQFSSDVEVKTGDDGRGHLYSHLETITTDLESDGFGIVWSGIEDD